PSFSVLDAAGGSAEYRHILRLPKFAGMADSAFRRPGDCLGLQRFSHYPDHPVKRRGFWLWVSDRPNPPGIPLRSKPSRVAALGIRARRSRDGLRRLAPDQARRVARLELGLARDSEDRLGQARLPRS